MTDLALIKERYDKGELEPIKLQLKHFICMNFNDFQFFLKKEQSIWGKPVELFTALRLYILDKKTIDFRSEMISQVNEINKELEVKGCSCNPEEAKKVKDEWLKVHAPAWRANRILEIIYVLNRNKNFFSELLKSGADDNTTIN